MAPSADIGHEYAVFNHANAKMIADSVILRDAVYQVVSDGKCLTRDLGGASSTETAANAVLETVLGRAR